MLQPPAISLPKGGGAIRGIGEKFSTNPVTGSASLSVPVPASPGRSGFTPQLTLSYDSAGGNGAFGLGWSLGVPSITRKTEKGLPRYRDAEESDTFILSGAEDLVPVLTASGERWKVDRADSTGRLYTVRRYRPRVEGLFARIERWEDRTTGEVHWRSISRDNVTTLYGRTSAARIADPADATRVFSWLIEESFDGKGNIIAYEYSAESDDSVGRALPNERHRLARKDAFANRYLTGVHYGNGKPAVRGDWLFSLVFDYSGPGQTGPDAYNARPWPVRQDPFSTYRAGFEVRTYRLCRRVLVFHHFPAPDLDRSPYLVRSIDLEYDEGPVATYLVSVTQRGYRWDSAAGHYIERSLPPLEFTYGRRTVDETIRTVDAESLEHLPAGLAGTHSHWVDLDSEGIAGVLTADGGGWYYKPNLGDVALPVTASDSAGPPQLERPAESVHFAPVELLAAQPSPADLDRGMQQLMDLAGDGRKYLVQFADPLPGYSARAASGEWEPFTPFGSVPNRDWRSPYLRLVDLTGDGFADILIMEEDVFTWHPSRATEGFGAAELAAVGTYEEEAPRLLLGDRREAIFLADMSGDGLMDVVRVRNGEICYWPNLGYGRFGAKVTMDGAPRLDDPDQFDQARIRLADTDGSGTDDLIYLGRDAIAIYFNHAGNGWSPPHRLTQFPATENVSSVGVLDLLGQGTACIVWSSPLPGDAHEPMRYVDLMGGRKPHLLESIRNNLGAETRLQFAPSTRFYLRDRAAGQPWVTRLPFPVHVVERRETRDAISGSKLVTLSRYHDGYYDAVEREFRGFAHVEQWDSESFPGYRGRGLFGDPPAEADDELHQPPVYTRSWFHTGAFLERESLSQYFAESGYYKGDAKAWLLPDTVMPRDLSADEEREACRALRGALLRQEIYARDGSSEAAHPYTVSERSYEVQPLQARGPNRHSVFFTHPREALEYHYERDPSDPRIAHSMTLEVDDCGNVTKSAAIVYPRRAPAFDEQARLLMTCTVAEVTNLVDTPDAHRGRQPWDTRTFELTGPVPTSGQPLSFTRVRDAVTNAPTLDYEATQTGAADRKRLIEHVRARFYADDLSGPLAFGWVGPLGIPYESYRLAFTPGLVAQVYGTRVSPALLSGDGGYVHLAGDWKWWIPSGRAVLASDAPAHFYLATKFRDPFGQVSTVTYDGYDLIVAETRDPLGNRTRASNDYRTLLPRLVTDPNGNRTEVAYDALGMVAGVALEGQAGRNEGDDLAGFEADPAAAAIAAYLLDPLSQGAALLRTASTRFLYDLWRFEATGSEPAVSATLAREIHSGDPGGAQSPIQHSLLYIDGLGREAQRKIRAEPGPAPLRDPTTGALVQEHTAKRWTGTGRTVYDNKGNPVKKYEPFFSSTHRYEDERDLVEWGVTPVLHYDPLGRLVRTDNADGTVARVDFDAWRETSGDPNDTVRESEWFRQRLPNFDPANPPVQPTPDEAAALKALDHADTPTVVHLDTLGRPFLTVADNGGARKFETRVQLDIEGNPRAVTDALGRQGVRHSYDMLGGMVRSASIDAGRRWVLGDVAGQPIRRWDGRGHTVRIAYDALRRPTHVYVARDTGPERLAERIVYGDSAGSGLTAQQRSSGNLRGKVYQHFDGAGVLTNEAYDFKGNLLRSTARLALAYRRHVDWKALASLTNVQAIGAAAAPLLETEAFTSATRYDALNRAISTLTPSNAAVPASEIRPTYNEAGLLEKIAVRLRGGATWTPFVTDVDYNARGQRELIAYRVVTGGAERTVRCRYEYDPLSFRLARLRTTRATDGKTLQDLRYTYDPVGNITAISDGAQQAIYFRNRRVDPKCEYEYDPLYRLTRADGREHLGLTGGSLKPPRQVDHDDATRAGRLHPGDGNAVGRYVERYTYDDVGNLLTVRHFDQSAPTPRWTRRYEYEPDPARPNVPKSNRLVKATPPGQNEGTFTAYTYDAHGNMKSMPHLAQMVWDFHDRLRAADLRGGGNVYFVYDSSGSRVRKVHEHVGGMVEERIYLGGLEIYRKRTGAGLTLERETLHVMDGQRRIALVETRTKGSDGSPARLTRYQLDNHLGSAVLEVDDAGAIISYEEYFPYGSTSYQAVRSGVAAGSKRYRYSGKERDEGTGLYYYGARYYAPWLGRWTNCDPAGMVDGPNLYEFVRSSPVCRLDPDGSQSNRDVFSQMPSWMQEKILRGELNDQVSSAIHTKQLQQFKAEETEAAPSWEDAVLGVMTLGMWNVGWQLARNEHDVASSPAFAGESRLLTFTLALGMTAGDYTGTRQIIEALRGQDTLNTRLISPDEGLRLLATGSAQLGLTLLTSGRAGAPEVQSNLQHVVRGGAFGRGIGVFSVRNSGAFTAAEGQQMVNAFRVMDIEAGMAGGMTRRSLSAAEEGLNAAARRVARSGGNRSGSQIGLRLLPDEAAAHLPDAGAGGHILGPFTGVSGRANKSWGAQLRRYETGFTFEGFSLIDRSTGQFLYASGALEHAPRAIDWSSRATFAASAGFRAALAPPTLSSLFMQARENRQ